MVVVILMCGGVGSMCVHYQDTFEAWYMVIVTEYLEVPYVFCLYLMSYSLCYYRST